VEGAARIERDRRGGRHGGRDRRGGRGVPGETALEPPLGARGRLWARAEVAAAVERRDEVLMLRRSSSADPKIPNLGYAPGPRVSQRDSATDQATAVAMHYLVTNTYPSRE
jgi:hypothetical protein